MANEWTEEEARSQETGGNKKNTQLQMPSADSSIRQDLCQANSKEMDAFQTLILEKYRLHTLIHTFSFVNLLPHVVFILPEFVIKISAVDINFSPARKTSFIIL
jgi:hypothetical protein